MHYKPCAITMHYKPCTINHALCIMNYELTKHFFDSLYCLLELIVLGAERDADVA